MWVADRDDQGYVTGYSQRSSGWSGALDDLYHGVDVPGWPHGYYWYGLHAWVEPVGASEAADDVAFEATFTPDGGAAVEDTAKATVFDPDVDVDADNDDGAGAPARSAAEEWHEEKAGGPGKIVAVNDDDTDKDRVPDFADFDGVTGEAFVPVVVQLPAALDRSKATVEFVYSASDPAAVTVPVPGGPSGYGTAAAGGFLRLWTETGSGGRDPADVAAGGDFVAAKRYSATALGFADGGGAEKTFWLEAVAAHVTKGGLNITVRIDPDGDGPFHALVADAVRVTAFDLNLNFNTSRRANVGNYVDVPTFDKPYQFWTNADRDVSGALDGDDGAVATSSDVDSKDAVIANSRDLEDFGSFQVFQSLQWLGDLGAEYKVRLTLADQPTGNAGVKLYLSNSYGHTYLHDTAVADSVRAYANAHYVGLLDDTHDVTLPAAAFRTDAGDGRHAAQLLFEGVSTGPAALVVQLVKGDAVLADGRAYLDLRRVTELYDHYTVGDTATMEWNEVPTVATKIQSAVANPFAPDDPDYVLFVHGWRMLPWERRSFAETAYKRLFWQGYNGGFGLFSWPTEWNSGTIYSHTTDARNYSRSERKAYWSARGLHGVLTTLNGTGLNKVHMFAHSMGNIVASEALRLEATSPTPRKIVSTYVLSQAASVAHAYDAAAPITRTSADTPEVYASYPGTGRPYFADINLAAELVAKFLQRKRLCPQQVGVWAIH